MFVSRWLAVALAGLVLAAPAAAADTSPRDVDHFLWGAQTRPAVAHDMDGYLWGGQDAAAARLVVAAPAPAADDGFDWASAAIGAGTAGGLGLVALGGLAATRHARLRAARAR